MTETKQRRFYRDGRTPASWTGSIMSALGFLIASLGAVTGPNWIAIGIGAVLIVGSLIAVLILRSLGYGQA